MDNLNAARESGLNTGLEVNSEPSTRVEGVDALLEEIEQTTNMR